MENGSLTKGDRVSLVLERIALACASAVLLVLAVVCLFEHTYMPLDSELAQFRPNSLWFYLLLAGTILLLPFLNRALCRVQARALFRTLAALALVAGLFLILHVSATLRDDPYYIYASANTINQGSYFTLQPGGYLYMYPYQLGLVTYERLLLLLCSDVRFLFSVNLILVLLIDLSLWKTAALLLDKTPSAVNWVIVFSFLFLPQLFFILFLYGLTPGLCALCAGLFFLVRFLRQGGWISPVLMVLFTVLACVLRSNFLIAAIAMAIVLFLEALRRRKAHFLAPALCVLLLVSLSGRAVTSLYSRASGTDIGDGMPKLLWLTMGLQDDEDSERLGGWYNEYTVDLYAESGYDNELASQQAMADLKTRLAELGAHPLYAAGFFFDKAVSTWCEPTFQSVWSGPQEQYSQSVDTPILKSLYQGGAMYDALNLLGSVFLFLLYALCGLYGILVFTGRLSCRGAALFPFIFFLGGFLFHLLWETKSQYVYPYVFLLLPAAAQALTSACTYAQTRLDTLRPKKS